MSDALNTRDTLLQGAAVRLLPPPNAAIVLSATTSLFHLNTAGVSDPTSITFTAKLIAMEGTVTFSAIGGTLTSISGNTCVLLASNMAGASATVTATLTYRGTVYTDTLAIAKVSESALSSTGSLYPVLDDATWSTSAPIVTVTGAPSGTTARRSNAGVDTVFNSTIMYAIDRSRTYRIRFWARASATANGVLYHTPRQFLADGVTPGPDNSGRDPYKPAGILPAAAQVWTEYSYLWTSADWQVGVTQVRPDFLLNYGGTAGYWEIQDYQFSDITEIVAAQAAADAAQTTANTAVTNAATAQAAADAAQADADTANATLGNIASDSILSIGEKPAVILAYNVINANATSIPLQAIALGVPYPDYTTAYGALSSYLAALSPAWDNLSLNTPIDGAVFRTKFSDLYNQQQITLNAIAAKAATLAAWATVSGVGKPSDYATTDVTLIASGGITLTGNTAEKTGGGAADWDTSVRSKDSAPHGAYVSAVAAFNYHHIMFGLNADAAADSNFTGIDYAVYLQADGTVGVYESGVNKGSPETYVAGDTFGVLDDGSSVRYLKNGAVFYTSLLAASLLPNKNLFFDSSFFNTGAKLNNIRFVPQTSNNFAQVGGVTKPQDNATVGAPSGTYVGSTLAQTVESNASSALANAAAAQTDATAANTALTAIFSDSVLSRDEKTDLVQRWGAVDAEDSGIIAQAAALSVSSTAYIATVDALAAYLNSLSPGWNDLTQNTTIVRADANAAWNNYYTAKVTILNAIAAKAATMATWAGGSISGRPTDAQLLNNRDNVVTNPGGGVRTSTTEVETGALKITLPVTWTNTMVRFTVQIYEYIAGYSCTLEIAGYNNTGPAWINVSAKVIGGNVEYPVYFGHDGTKCAVWIGAAAETWTYPQVRVSDVFVGYSNTSMATWENGWAISFDPAGAINVSQLVLDTYPGADWAKSARRPANLAALAGSEGIQNTLVTIGSNGALSGGGGGSVTIGGLGYTGDLNASLDIKLVVRGTGLALSGNNASRTGGLDFDADCYSLDAYTGGCAASFIPTADGYYMAGLNTDPTLNTTYTGLDYAFYCPDTSSVYIYESGAAVGGGTIFATFTVGDVFSVAYDGVNVRYMQNGTVVRTVAAAANLKFHFDSSIVAGGLNNIRFGPLTNNDWSAIGGEGRPSNNANMGPADAATALGFNPQFSDWPTGQARPTGWTLWSGNEPTKDTSVIRTSPFAVRWTLGSVSTGMARQLAFQIPLPVGDYITGSFDAYIVSNAGGTGKPGYLIRLFTNEAQTTYVDNFSSVARNDVSGWQRTPFTAGVGEGQQIWGITIYQMASYSGMSGGEWSIGSCVVFDNLTFDFKQRVTAANAATIISPGGITTGSLAADSVTTAKLAAGAVTASKISVTELSAIIANLGTVTVSTGGSMSSGQTAFNTGTGWFLGMPGGVPKFSCGVGGGVGITFDGTNFVVTPPAFTMSAMSELSSTGANGLRSYGSRTASLTGGQSPFTYSWAKDMLSTSGSVIMTNTTTATVSVSVNATNAEIEGVVTCTVTDANGRVVIGSFDLSGIHGTPP